MALAAIALAALASAGPAAGEVPRRLLATEVGVSTGLIGAGFTTYGGRSGDLVTSRSIAGRLVLRGLVIDAHARLDTPLHSDFRGESGILQLRLGWSSWRWSVVGGVVLHHGFFAEPAFQLLPAARAQLKVGEVTVVAGLFDYQGFAPLHLSFEHGDFGVGYLAPFGLESHFRLRLREYLGVIFQGMVLRAGRTELVMATMAISGGYSSGKPPADRAPIPIIFDDRL